MVQIMDQSQHTSADSGGEGAAYEFCQGLDAWEKERKLYSNPPFLPALGVYVTVIDLLTLFYTTNI
jgi:hypothetical protein